MEQLSFLHITLLLFATGVIIFSVLVFIGFFKKFMLDEPVTKLLKLIWIPIIPLLLVPWISFFLLYFSSGFAELS